MKLKFENQQFQLQAVRSVIELFNGFKYLTMPMNNQYIIKKI